MINTKYIISTILILTLLVSAASAASLTVGSKYKTIKSAVDAAHVPVERMGDERQRRSALGCLLYTSDAADE